MAERQRLVTAYPPPPSPARTRPAEREPLRLGLVQERWHASADEHREALGRGIRTAAAEGARVVCLQELTLSPYFAITPDGPTAAGGCFRGARDWTDDRVRTQARRRDRRLRARVAVRTRRRADGLGFNTAVLVAPDGRLVSRTRKMHIPITAGYDEDRYFRPGPAGGDAFHLVPLPTGDGEAQLGLPTCWDQWFPASRARTRSRAPRC